MYTFLAILLFFIASIHCLGRVCDLEFEKCDLLDKECIQKFELAVRRWFNKPEARGYFMKAVDPLYLGDFVVDFKDKKVLLPNTTIRGLDSSVYTIRSTIFDPKTSSISYKNLFTHGVTLTADAPTVVNLANGMNSTELKSVFLEFDSVSVDTPAYVKYASRCDGVNHLDLNYRYIKTKDGTVTKAKGLEQYDGKERKELINAILTRTGEITTKMIYEDFINLFHIVDYDCFFKLGPFAPEEDTCKC